MHQYSPVYSCPMHPEVIGDEGEKCPKCGMFLVEVSENANSETSSNESKSIDDNSSCSHKKAEVISDEYYCPMHCEGDKTYDKPGNCPVCGMHLMKKENSEIKSTEDHASCSDKKQEIKEIITLSTRIFQNTQIVDDIHNINEQLNIEYLRLADVKMKIEKYNEINDLTKQSNEKGKEILEKTIEYEAEYNQYSENIENIETHFQNLVQAAYGEDGVLNYSYENDVKKRSSTGRIKICCQIADENSHGRLYMKINMFDLALFLNRIDNNTGCDLLIHDGSYCKPNPGAKAKVVNYVDNYLKDAEKGQYFITINKSEVEETDLEDFRKKKMIVAANSASTERVFRYQLNIDSDCF